MNCLKRVYLCEPDERNEWNWEKIFVCNPKLEYLSIDCSSFPFNYGSFDRTAFLESIKRALFRLKGNKVGQKELFIRIKICIKDKNDSKLFASIADAMYMGNIDDYMLEIVKNDTTKDYVFDEMFEDLSK